MVNERVALGVRVGLGLSGMGVVLGERVGVEVGVGVTLGKGASEALATAGIKCEATESVVDFKRERAAPVVPIAARFKNILRLLLSIGSGGLRASC